MASTEDFTADEVFDMLVESSNVVKVAYTEVRRPHPGVRWGTTLVLTAPPSLSGACYQQTADGQLITGDRIEIVKDAGERNARVNDLLEREELVRQQSARSGLVHTPVDAAPPLVSDAVSDAQLFELARRLQEGVRDGDVRTVRLYKSAVVAKHVVDWLAAHAPKIVGGAKTGAPTPPCKRPVAVALAQRMVDAGWLVPAEDAKAAAPFADDGTVFRYLLRVLQDDACPAAVAERLHGALWAPSGGIATHTEKIMLKTVHKYVGPPARGLAAVAARLRRFGHHGGLGTLRQGGEGRRLERVAAGPRAGRDVCGHVGHRQGAAEARRAGARARDRHGGHAGRLRARPAKEHPAVALDIPKRD